MVQIDCVVWSVESIFVREKEKGHPIKKVAGNEPIDCNNWHFSEVFL